MKIFVSYSRQSKAHAEELIRNLKKLGHEVWYDQEIVGGDAWWAKILDNIKNCQVFIFAHSELAGFSEACTFELDYAQKLNRPIIPVILEGDQSEDAIPSNISGLHYIDYRQKDADAALNLYSALSKVPEKVPLPAPLPQPPPTPRISRKIPPKSSVNVTPKIDLVPIPDSNTSRANYSTFLWLFICVYIGSYGWFSLSVNESARLAVASSHVNQPMMYDGERFRNAVQVAHVILVNKFSNAYPLIDPAGDFPASMFLAFFFGAAGAIVKTCQQVLEKTIQNTERNFLLIAIGGGFAGVIILGIYYIVLTIWHPEFQGIPHKTILLFACLIGGYVVNSLRKSVNSISFSIF